MSAESKQDRWLDVKDRMGERRLEFGRQLTDWYYHQPNRLLDSMAYYKFASKLFGPGKRVLDLGCGEGLGTWLLAVENGSALGVDPDEEAIACAARNYGHDARIQFRCEDFPRTPPQPFDGIVCFDVIERLVRDKVPAFWGRLTDNLTHDGILVVGTPNIAANPHASPAQQAVRTNLYSSERLETEMSRSFHHVFLFAGNDELVHTGFLAMAPYLLAVGCRKRSQPAE